MRDIPQASVSIVEKRNGNVEVSVLSKENAEELYLVGDGVLELGDNGDTVTLSQVDELRVVAVTSDGNKAVIRKHRTRSNASDNSFRVVDDETMTVEKAKERYVDGETWELELENELELALE
jgi:hypothetical protein